jgi:hypothetical protein
MIADRKGWRGSRRASFSILLRARYRRAASACRMARGTGLAGRPRLGVHFASPTMPLPDLVDPLVCLLMWWLLYCFYGLL